MIQCSTYVFFEKQKGDKPEVNELPVNEWALPDHSLLVSLFCCCSSFASKPLLTLPFLLSMSSRLLPHLCWWKCSPPFNVWFKNYLPQEAFSVPPHWRWFLWPERPENFVYTSNQLLARVLHSGYQIDFVLWWRQGSQDNILPTIVPPYPALDNQGQASLDRITHSMGMRSPVTTSCYIPSSDYRGIPKI